MPVGKRRKACEDIGKYSTLTNWIASGSVIYEEGGLRLALGNQSVSLVTGARRAQLLPTVLCCIWIWTMNGSTLQVSYQLLGYIRICSQPLNGVTQIGSLQ
jgi:hypothetical protein